MRTILLIIVSVLVSHLQGQSKTEDFGSFSYQFFSDSTFQLDRIVFPLPHLSPTHMDTIDSLFLQKNDWTFSDFSYWQNSFNVRLYDNFQRKLRDTKNRVVSFEGNGNGINMKLLFKLIKGKWFLIRIEDWST